MLVTSQLSERPQLPQPTIHSIKSNQFFSAIFLHPGRLNTMGNETSTVHVGPHGIPGQLEANNDSMRARSHSDMVSSSRSISGRRPSLSTSSPVRQRSPSIGSAAFPSISESFSDNPVVEIIDPEVRPRPGSMTSLRPRSMTWGEGGQKESPQSTRINLLKRSKRWKSKKKTPDSTPAGTTTQAEEDPVMSPTGAREVPAETSRGTFDRITKARPDQSEQVALSPVTDVNALILPLAGSPYDGESTKKVTSVGSVLSCDSIPLPGSVGCSSITAGRATSMCAVPKPAEKSGVIHTDSSSSFHSSKSGAEDLDLGVDTAPNLIPPASSSSSYEKESDNDGDGKGDTVQDDLHGRHRTARKKEQILGMWRSSKKDNESTEKMEKIVTKASDSTGPLDQDPVPQARSRDSRASPRPINVGKSILDKPTVNMDSHPTARSSSPVRGMKNFPFRDRSRERSSEVSRGGFDNALSLSASSSLSSSVSAIDVKRASSETDKGWFPKFRTTFASQSRTSSNEDLEDSLKKAGIINLQIQTSPAKGDIPKGPASPTLSFPLVSDTSGGSLAAPSRNSTLERSPASSTFRTRLSTLTRHAMGRERDSGTNKDDDLAPLRMRSSTWSNPTGAIKRPVIDKEKLKRMREAKASHDKLPVDLAVMKPVLTEPPVWVPRPASTFTTAPVQDEPTYLRLADIQSCTTPRDSIGNISSTDGLERPRVSVSMSRGSIDLNSAGSSEDESGYLRLTDLCAVIHSAKRSGAHGDSNDDNDLCLGMHTTNTQADTFSAGQHTSCPPAPRKWESESADNSTTKQGN